MKVRRALGIILGVFLILVTAGCLKEAPPATSPPTTTAAPETPAPVNLGLVAHGGRLYDKWWVEMNVSAPQGDHPLWATQTTNTRKGTDTWRCKECHGWDYKGKDGAYGSGSHFTGFPGVLEASRQKTAEELTAAMKGATNPKHDFTSTLGDLHIGHIVLFLKNGLIDETRLIDYKTKKPIGGNLANGEMQFTNLCASCHGKDGRKLNFGSSEEPEYIGTVANDNPWEFLHKDRMGQPGSDPPMPSTLVLRWTEQDGVDVLAYAQTLPEK